MIKGKKTIVTYLIVVVVLLVGGIVLGYYIWGVERGEKPNYKAYLSKTMNYLTAIEHENQALKEKNGHGAKRNCHAYRENEKRSRQAERTDQKPSIADCINYQG